MAAQGIELFQNKIGIQGDLDDYILPFAIPLFNNIDDIYDFSLPELPDGPSSFDMEERLSIEIPHADTQEATRKKPTKRPAHTRHMSWQRTLDRAANTESIGRSGSVGPQTGSSVRSHYAVEKRYREALNEKYRDLETTLFECKSRQFGWNKNLIQSSEPSTSTISASEGEMLVSQPRKQNKAQVLQEAIDYIRSLEANCRITTVKIKAISSVANAQSSRLTSTLSLLDQMQSQD